MTLMTSEKKESTQSDVSYTHHLSHITNQDQKLDQTHRMPNNPANFL